MKILLIEDNAELAEAMADFLELQGATCDFAYSGSAGLEIAQQPHQADVIILDLMLPNMSGFDVCTQLRASGITTPVLMLTACDTQSDQLQGFQVGIDDYVVKPCSMPLLWARLQALHRRNTPQADTLTIGPLTLYLKERRITRDDQELRLTPTGWQIISLLAKRSPNVVSRSELEEHAWPDTDVDARNVNVQLHQLRKAVDKPFDSPMIHTLTGVGICLREKDTENHG
ncbi:two-component system response regulator [Gammaproteobacteria bacterium 45_16_T64]|nr:two-component system response regulator [Gammaproteobacteria bacterium 45_16_T64]